MTTSERLLVLEERLEGNSIQTKRLISHIESEQRVSGNHEKRIDALEKSFDRMQKQIDKHEMVLYNTGKGLIVDVKELQTTRKESRNWWRDLLGIASFMIALALAIKEILQ